MSDYSVAGVVIHFLHDAAYYGVKLVTAHNMIDIMKLTLVGVFSGAVGHLSAKGLFTKAVGTETVVESPTLYRQTNIESPSGNDYTDQIIHTVSTYKLSKALEEATIDPAKLSNYIRRAAKHCTDDEPAVFLHLHEALRRKGVYNWMPRQTARKFGRFDEEERRQIINEIARCFRNYKSEILTPSWFRKLSPEEKERVVWAYRMPVLIFQDGHGAHVFTEIDMMDHMDGFIPSNREDLRYVYEDPENPVVDPDSHLFQRAAAIRSLRESILRDYATGNPIINKGFVRYPLGVEGGALDPSVPVIDSNM